MTLGEQLCDSRRTALKNSSVFRNLGQQFWNAGTGTSGLGVGARENWNDGFGMPISIIITWARELTLRNISTGNIWVYTVCGWWGMGEGEGAGNPYPLELLLGGRLLQLSYILRLLIHSSLPCKVSPYSIIQAS